MSSFIYNEKQLRHGCLYNPKLPLDKHILPVISTTRSSRQAETRELYYIFINYTIKESHLKKQGKPKNPQKIPTTTTRKPTPKQERILNTKQDHPELTTREIAAICDTGHSHVIATFQRYHVDQVHIEEFKSHRADIFAGLQHRLLQSVTDTDIKKAPMGTRVLAAAQLYDKEQIERGHGADARPLVMIQINTAVDKPVDNLIPNNINIIEAK